MPRLIWDKRGERIYETGVECGVIYPQNAFGEYPKGAVWNGLDVVTESPSGSEPSNTYADNKKYLSLISAEEYNATVEAYGYPSDFKDCLDSGVVMGGLFIGQQKKRIFGLSYKTIIGNDLDSNEHGYKLHLVYGCLASPPEKSYSSVNDSPEAITFSWEVTTTPVPFAGYRPISSIVLDSRKIIEWNLKLLEDILYGSDDTDARLPLPDEVFHIVTNQLLDSKSDALEDSFGDILLDNKKGGI